MPAVDQLTFSTQVTIIGSLAAGGQFDSNYNADSNVAHWVNNPDKANLNAVNTATASLLPGSSGEFQNARVPGNTRMPSAQSLATSILRNSELLARLDKKLFLSVANELRQQSIEVEDTMIGADHPHLKWLSSEKDPFLDDMIAMDIAEHASY